MNGSLRNLTIPVITFLICIAMSWQAGWQSYRASLEATHEMELKLQELRSNDLRRLEIELEMLRKERVQALEKRLNETEMRLMAIETNQGGA